ncbi:MAG TPA: SBBP repeat-containing protein, partial [Candidatus Angelobacter sp.]|nr:SBBP repeat-containing protein [Candidatus Angelobacter sp.]
KAGDAGTWDAILTVLNPSGSAPLYSTHLGGGTPPDPGASSNSAGTHLALDTNGNVYLTGWTYSISFPTTPGAFQTVNKSLFGEANAFVAKFSGFQTAQ